MNSNPTPRIYVASLSDYNNGVLHGIWIEATDADTIQEATDKMLASSPTGGAEEWAIHDHEGFEGVKVSEFSSFADIAELGAAIEEHGALFTALMGQGVASDVSSALEYLEENYAGAHNSLEDFAYEFHKDSGTELGALSEYIDWEKVGRDLELGGDVFEIDLDGKTHVFWNR